MTRYLLNSAVVTSPGVYAYRRVTPGEARAWAAAAPWVSSIGYAETAALAAEVLGVDVPVDRRTIGMQPGDEALVIRIVLPPGTPRIDPQNKGRLGEVLRAGHTELGLLRRVDGELLAVRALLAASRDAFRSKQIARARAMLDGVLEEEKR